jgi:hypothetical protein
VLQNCGYIEASDVRNIFYIFIMTNNEKPKRHQWKKGESGNPKGKPKGAVSTDRSIAIKALFQLFTENINLFKTALLEKYKKDPIKFWEEYIRPFQPSNEQLHEIEKNISGPEGQHVIVFGRQEPQ